MNPALSNPPPPHTHTHADPCFPVYLLIQSSHDAACREAPECHLSIKPGGTDVVFILDKGVEVVKNFGLEKGLLYLVGQVELKTSKVYKVRPCVGCHRGVVLLPVNVRSHVLHLVPYLLAMNAFPS